jgi:hypothetical protein
LNAAFCAWDFYEARRGVTRSKLDNSAVVETLFARNAERWHFARDRSMAIEHSARVA